MCRLAPTTSKSPIDYNPSYDFEWKLVKSIFGEVLGFYSRRLNTNNSHDSVMTNDVFEDLVTLMGSLIITLFVNARVTGHMFIFIR